MPKTDPRIEAQITELRKQAKTHLSQHRFEDALACLETAIDLQSTSYKLYRLRSITLCCLHEYSRAAQDAQKVIELAPHVMDGYYHKGFALFHLKDYIHAAQAFQDGLKLNPTDKTLRQGYWDSVSLISQSRQDATKVVHGVEKSLASMAMGSQASPFGTPQATFNGQQQGKGQQSPRSAALFSALVLGRESNQSAG